MVKKITPKKKTTGQKVKAARKPIKKVKPAVKPKPKVAVKPVVSPSPQVLRWRAPDYYTFERSPYWSLAVGLVAIVLCLILIYTNNLFPIVIILLAVIVTFQLAHEKPKEEEFALDDGGVLARNEYIPYLEIKSYWVARHGERSILYLEPINPFKAPIAIPLEKASPKEVKLYLLRYVPEKFEYGEMLSDRLIRIFKL